MALVSPLLQSTGQYPDPPMEATADSLSSLVPSSGHYNPKKRQHFSPLRRLVKLVSPIKALPSLIMHRKVSKK